MYLLNLHIYMDQLKHCQFSPKCNLYYILNVLNQVMRSIQSLGICSSPAVSSTILKGRRLSILYSQHLTNLETCRPILIRKIKPTANVVT